MHTTVVPLGHSRKLHHPGLVPSNGHTALSESDYKVKGLRGKKKTRVVHFNRLKLCTPGTRFLGLGETVPTPEELPETSQSALQDQHVIGQDLDMPDIDTNDLPSRYPARPHARPNWYGIRV